jgi:serine/threonine-protein phosphatase 4 catalytic subunit
MSEIDHQIEQVKQCEYIKESDVKTLCTKAKEIFLSEPNVLPLEAPVTVSPLADLWGHSWAVL